MNSYNKQEGTLMSNKPQQSLRIPLNVIAVSS